MNLRWLVAPLTLALLATHAASAEVPAGLKNLRRHFFDAPTNALTFHSVDQIFPIRRVDAAGPAWVIPRAEARLDFSYEVAGKTHAAEEVLERTFTNALIVIKHGRIVREVYRNQTDETTHFISFSMAKSVTSILFGIALADGSVHSLNDDITQYVPELKYSAYDGVTIRQVLMMRSGADYDERYDFERPGLTATGWEESFVRNRMRFAAFARAFARGHAPGEFWNYSTFDTAVLGWVLERATKQTVSHYMTEKLWKPAGMEAGAYWLLDGPAESGHEFVGGGLNAVARDYARLGLLMLNQGKANGHQILTPAWVREATIQAGPEPVDPDSPYGPYGYQYQWWTLPETKAFIALGLQGQFIYVDPATETVIVKLSYFPPGEYAPYPETLAFFRAASRWQGP